MSAVINEDGGGCINPDKLGNLSCAGCRRSLASDNLVYFEFLI